MVGCVLSQLKPSELTFLAVEYASAPRALSYTEPTIHHIRIASVQDVCSNPYCVNKSDIKDDDDDEEGGEID